VLIGILRAVKSRSALVLTLVLFAAIPARADAPSARVRLEWTSDNGCLDASTLRTQVEEALGREAFANTGEADLVLSGHAEAGTKGFESVVTLSTASGEVLGTRTLTSSAARCDELSLGLPLALAMMIDLPLREATVHVAVHVPPPPREEPPVRPPLPPPVVKRVHTALVAGPLLRFGWIPNVAIGARIAAETQIGPVRLGVEGTWVAPSIEDDSVVSARVWGVSGALYGCPLVATSPRLYAALCAYAEGGVVVADGVKVTIPRSDVAGALSVGARLRGGLRVFPWTVGVELGGGAFLVRPGIVYDLSSGGSVSLAEAWPATLDIVLFGGMSFP
jgi:hypothetical protein